MLFWIIGLVIAALGAVPVILTLLRAEGGAAAESDMALYRDQMAEIDRDLARGVLTEDEAERTRAEVGRRLLEADKRGPRAVSQAPKLVRLTAVAVVVLAVGAGGVALYVMQGAPGYPDLPLVARIADADARRANRPTQAEAEARAAASLPNPSAPSPDFAALMDRLRQAVKDRPNDAQGLALLAQNELRLGRYKAARTAQEQLIALQGDDVTAETLAGMAEIFVSQAGGIVTPEAELIVDGALGKDRNNLQALYFKGLAAAQVGRFDVTFRVWRDALDRSSEDGPLREMVLAQMPDVAARAGQDYTPPTKAPDLRGPDQSAMAAAADMDPAAREEMIRGMVNGLSERLATQGGTAPEWAQLIAALGVLGESERGRAILGEARQVFANQPDDLQVIEDAAARGGL